MSEAKQKPRTTRAGNKPVAAATASTVAAGTNPQAAQAEQEAMLLAAQQAQDEADAEAKRKEFAKEKAELAAEKEKEDAEAKAAAQLKQLQQDGKDDIAKTNGDKGAGLAGVDAALLLGAFSVRAKSPAGFWRSGVKFHRLEETLVLVVEPSQATADAILALGSEYPHVVCLTAAKAKRVHGEPNLVVTDIALEDLATVQA